MLFRVSPHGVMTWPGSVARCALGRAGVRAAECKREGDGVTPAGLWPIRRILWRADRIDRPATRLPATPLAEDDGWCDDPEHTDYNRQVRLPHPARAEQLWREDRLYDLVVIIGHNDQPVRPGAGSAIFVHVARSDYGATEGCIGLAIDDLIRFTSAASLGDVLHVGLEDET